MSDQSLSNPFAEEQTQKNKENLTSLVEPIRNDVTDDAIQVINDDQEYNQKDIVPFINKIKDNDYHVISIFGSQSSGKSTLLNHLFNTKFQTMNEQIKRGQTTKGIWMSNRIVPTSGKNLLIMDVEGSDGVEKSDDKDFERKACLFALSSSEILIINVWEHQIGLYQGNNMELLKIVFEVNLQLFHSAKSDHKVLLMFVIRDHIGMTPLQSLKETLSVELDKMWEQIKKPENIKNSSFTDFFDLEFKGFSHYFLQNEKFLEDCKSLRGEFDTETIFKNDKYKLNKTLPLDGWEMYSQNCWNVISSSEQLDLPTQQILVAKFKTKEIADEILEAYKVKTKENLATKGFDFSKLGADIQEGLDKFDDLGGRYDEPVYLEERENLLKAFQLMNYDALAQNLDEDIHDNIILEDLQSKLMDKKAIKATPSFVERSSNVKNTLISGYTKILSSLLKLSVINEFNNEKLLQTFNLHLKSLLEQENKKESLKITKKINKELTNHLNEFLEVSVSKPDLTFWDQFKDYYQKALNELLAPYTNDEKGFEFPLNFNKAENKEFIGRLANSNIKSLKKSITDLTSVQKLSLILEEQYKNIFLTDAETQAPRFFENMTIPEMEKLDTDCRAKCEEWLEMFSKGTNLSKFNENVYGEKIDISSYEENNSYNESEDEDASDDDELSSQKDILTGMKKTKILQEFNKKIQIINLQTKRTILQSRANTKIPGYIYVLLFILGYSKIIYVLKNPIWILTLLLLASSWVFVHKSGQYQFVYMIVQKWVDMIKQIFVSKLKEFLDDNNNNTNNKEQVKESSNESFEMKDLSEKEKSKE